MYRRVPGILYPDPQKEFALAVIKEGSTVLDRVFTHSPIEKDVLAQLMEDKYGFDGEELLHFFKKDSFSNAIILNVDVMRESGSFYKESS